MVGNEKLRRDIPKGWSCSDIKSALNIFTGKKDVSKAIPGPYKFFSCAPEPISSNEYMYDGEVVLVSGNGSYTGRVGYFNGKFDLYQRTYACVLKSESDAWMPFYYYTLRYMFQPVFSGGKHGSSIPYIVLGDLADFKFAKELTIINRFVSIVTPMFNEQFKRLVETEQLIKQRNELLPLLMNGQVSVNSDLAKCISEIGIVAIIRNYPNSLLKYWRLVIIYKCRITFSYNFSSHFASLPSPLQTSSTSSNRLLPPRQVCGHPSEGRKRSCHHRKKWQQAFRL